jgi:hypothetical protein
MCPSLGFLLVLPPAARSGPADPAPQSPATPRLALLTIAALAVPALAAREPQQPPSPPADPKPYFTEPAIAPATHQTMRIGGMTIARLTQPGDHGGLPVVKSSRLSVGSSERS